jgi:hypothetical protein
LYGYADVNTHSNFDYYEYMDRFADTYSIGDCIADADI